MVSYNKESFKSGSDLHFKFGAPIAHFATQLTSLVFTLVLIRKQVNMGSSQSTYNTETRFSTGMI